MINYMRQDYALHSNRTVLCTEDLANWPIGKPKAYSRYWEASSSPPIPRWTSSLSIGGISSTDSSKSSSRLIPFLNQYSWNHYISLIGLFLRCWYCKLWQEHFVLPCANDPQLHNNNNNNNNLTTNLLKGSKLSAPQRNYFHILERTFSPKTTLFSFKYTNIICSSSKSLKSLHLSTPSRFCHSDRGPWAACNRSQEQNNTIQF